MPQKGLKSSDESGHGVRRRVRHNQTRRVQQRAASTHRIGPAGIGRADTTRNSRNTPLRRAPASVPPPTPRAAKAVNHGPVRWPHAPGPCPTVVRLAREPRLLITFPRFFQCHVAWRLFRAMPHRCAVPSLLLRRDPPFFQS